METNRFRRIWKHGSALSSRALSVWKWEPHNILPYTTGVWEQVTINSASPTPLQCIMSDTTLPQLNLANLCTSTALQWGASTALQWGAPVHHTMLAHILQCQTWMLTCALHWGAPVHHTMLAHTQQCQTVMLTSAPPQHYTEVPLYLVEVHLQQLPEWKTAMSLRVTLS